MKILVSLIIVALASTASAKEALVDSFSGQGYGPAGCGFGSLVFGQKPGAVQIIASTTNGTSGSQTFGISSGTLNCGAGAFAKAAAFVDTNKVALEKDMVRGEGETLATLAQIFECKNEGFNATMKAGYQKAMSSQEITKMAQNACNI